ncbi:hypothetical protein IQ256_05440 [cf. Phormidesmis sp. LEGE 11477]|nr:hypothetical protein [cf. Phormidesmis sp. LEGE 11477]
MRPVANTSVAETLMATQSFTLHVRPSSRYLDFLPDVYSEIDFIGRLLKIFEQSFDPSVQTLSTLWAYLDPLSAPEAMLPFLAQWVGWPTETAWGVDQQRKLIRRAVEIYRWRGTRKGLMLYLHLYTGLGQPPTALSTTQTADFLETESITQEGYTQEDQIQEQETLGEISIEENFSRGFLIGAARLGQNAIIGGGQPFHFTVRLKTPYPLDQPLIHAIIAQEKPAFCTYDLIVEAL